MSNQITVVGNLTDAPELRFTPEGHNFSVVFVTSGNVGLAG